MIVDIRTRRLRTIEQFRAFAEGNEAVDLQPRDRDEAYGFARDTLERFGHRRLGKRDKGVVPRLPVAATGISRKQTERLVRELYVVNTVKMVSWPLRRSPEVLRARQGEFVLVRP